MGGREGARKGESREGRREKRGGKREERWKERGGKRVRERRDGSRGEGQSNSRTLNPKTSTCWVSLAC